MMKSYAFIINKKCFKFNILQMAILFLPQVTIKSINLILQMKITLSKLIISQSKMYT